MHSAPTTSPATSTALGTAPATAPGPYRSKTLATWLGLLGGPLGLHRFYLGGLGDVWGWLHPLPTLLGLWGLHRMDQLGQDDRLAWLLLPLLGLSFATAMLQTILIGLTPDERWHARHNPGHGDPQHLPASGWVAVIAVILALMVGAGVLMATIAFSGQRYFEYQVEEALKISQ